MAADEIYEFVVTTPAGTLSSAPLVTATTFPARIVRRIDWRVPGGSLGLMGWAISMRNVPILPRNAGAFIVAHSTSGGYDVANMPDSGDWSVTSYNTGAFAHSLYLTFHCDVIRPAPKDFALLDDYALAGDPAPDYAGY